MLLFHFQTLILVLLLVMLSGSYLRLVADVMSCYSWRHKRLFCRRFKAQRLLVNVPTWHTTFRRFSRHRQSPALPRWKSRSDWWKAAADSRQFFAAALQTNAASSVTKTIPGSNIHTFTLEAWLFHTSATNMAPKDYMAEKGELVNSFLAHTEL